VALNKHAGVIHGEQGGNMLVLDRRLDEGFFIGDTVYVKILGIKRGRVKLGIRAPSDVSVVREELLAGQDGVTGSSSGVHRRNNSPASSRP